MTELLGTLSSVSPDSGATCLLLSRASRLAAGLLSFRRRSSSPAAAAPAPAADLDDAISLERLTGAVVDSSLPKLTAVLTRPSLQTVDAKGRVR